MNRMKALIGGAALVLLVGIVGAVEHGAELSLMVWTAPLLSVLWIVAGQARKHYEQEDKDE